MSKKRYVLDSSIIISIVKGLMGTASSVSLPLDGKMYISVITRIEALAYPNMKAEEETKIRGLLRHMKVVPLNRKVEQNAILIRAQTKRKLPDCIVAAAALSINGILLSNDMDFRNLNVSGLTVRTVSPKA
ncbi:MAG: type II toxin-antitoxin system VapC family toxin [Treponema sp.]|nr:type II toxin-antitoxin system VapC family toxin [Treponema sp.]